MAVIMLAYVLDVHEITLKNVQNIIDAIGIPRESFPVYVKYKHLVSVTMTRYGLLI